ncbi:hypothetical protein BpHYR1_006202 [Brachionus plicatilis]|uniref:Uncharacterized protein n=1 Tax=Brachionus plicatilis TaxID=10195 RepID=A0A3M7R540_BRAPC|nr:hypothetical protein BpHYR1_006202 [Brachionus plicatilis]
MSQINSPLSGSQLKSTSSKAQKKEDKIKRQLFSKNLFLYFDRLPDRQLKAGIIRPISSSSESGSEHSIDDATQNTNSSSNSESEITNADRIALNPSSSIENEFESLKEEQEKDEDIQWIKGLVWYTFVTERKLST